MSNELGQISRLCYHRRMMRARGPACCCSLAAGVRPAHGAPTTRSRARGSSTTSASSRRRCSRRGSAADAGARRRRRPDCGARLSRAVSRERRVRRSHQRARSPAPARSADGSARASASIRRRPRRGAVLRRRVRRRGDGVRLGARTSRDALTGEARERVLDWWATRDRSRGAAAARDRAAGASTSGFATRMDDELATHPGSAAASYWLAAAARGAGRSQAAWDAAQAGVGARAACRATSGDALRADLDRLVLRGDRPRAREGARRSRPSCCALSGSASRSAGSDRVRAVRPDGTF